MIASLLIVLANVAMKSEYTLGSLNGILELSY
nr:MAG TPA: hypothetical protein [Crassvirales sp.]